MDSQEAAPVKRPDMSHLAPDFWTNAEHWSDVKWREYLHRRTGWWNRLKNRVEQAGHRWLGRLSLYAVKPEDRFSEAWWHAREAGQWPSDTGIGDPAEDEANWLRGAGRGDEADALVAAVRERWPEFTA